MRRFTNISDFARTPSTLRTLSHSQSHRLNGTLTFLNSVRFARKFFRVFSGVSFVFSCGTPAAFFELICLDRMRTSSTLCALCRLQSHPYECSRAYKALCDWEGIADLCLTKVAKGATVKPPFGATRLILQCFARKFFRVLSGVSFVFSCGTPVAFFELIQTLCVCLCVVFCVVRKATA